MPRPLTVPAFLIALMLPATAVAEDAWATRDAQALRWPDAEQTSLDLESGDKVTVVYRADGMVRVRKGADFGWVPEDALTDQDPTPEPAAADPWEIPDMPSLEIPGRGKAPAVAPAPDAAPAAPAVPPPESE